MSSPIIHQFSTSMISPSPSTDHITPLYIVFHGSLLRVDPNERPSGLHPGKAGTTTRGYLPATHGLLSHHPLTGDSNHKEQSAISRPAKPIPATEPFRRTPSLQLLPPSAYLTPTHLLRLSSDTDPSRTHLDTSLPSLWKRVRRPPSGSCGPVLPL